jgi:hypothetical protein
MNAPLDGDAAHAAAPTANRAKEPSSTSYGIPLADRPQNQPLAETIRSVQIRQFA